MADIPEAAYEAAARALAGQTGPRKHGQLCPIWTLRRKSPAIDRCDCWILANARSDIRAAVDAAWATAVAEGRRRALEEVYAELGPIADRLRSTARSSGDKTRHATAAGVSLARLRVTEMSDPSWAARTKGDS